MSLGGVATNRKFEDRRTYIGALPAIYGIASEHKTPYYPDEIDKLAQTFRRPSGRLPGSLRPAQNTLWITTGVAFDLSEVLFLATANSLHTIPPALMDRMEVLEVSGYTEAEKLEIARRYLVKRQIPEHGLSPKKHPSTKTPCKK